MIEFYQVIKTSKLNPKSETVIYTDDDLNWAKSCQKAKQHDDKDHIYSIKTIKGREFIG